MYMYVVIVSVTKISSYKHGLNFSVYCKNFRLLISLALIKVRNIYKLNFLSNSRGFRWKFMLEIVFLRAATLLIRVDLCRNVCLGSFDDYNKWRDVSYTNQAVEQLNYQSVYLELCWMGIWNIHCTIECRFVNQGRWNIVVQNHVMCHSGPFKLEWKAGNLHATELKALRLLKKNITTG